MFDHLAAVRIYEKALEILSDPSWSEKLVYLHDYDGALAQVYRTKKDYTLNGLYWGYANCIVNDVTGESLPYDGGTTYARFVGSRSHNVNAASEQWNYGNNSRHSKVPYGDVKEIIELSIRQKLDEARVAAKCEEVYLGLWKEKVITEYGAYLPAVVRIVSNDESFRLIILQPEKFSTHGMGSFLNHIEKGDVSMSRETFQRLSRIPSRRGIMGIEIFRGPVLGFFGSEPDTGNISSEGVSVDKHGWQELADKITVQE